MRKLSNISILLGLLTGYLVLVCVSGLILTPFWDAAGPLVIQVGPYGVTSETPLGYFVCVLVTIGLMAATWALLGLIPKKLTRSSQEAHKKLTTAKKRLACISNG